MSSRHYDVIGSSTLLITDAGTDAISVVLREFSYSYPYVCHLFYYAYPPRLVYYFTNSLHKVEA